MKKVLALFGVLILASPVLANFQTQTDIMSLYFDLDGCLLVADGVATGTEVSIYLIIINPSFDALFGFEAGIFWEGNAEALEMEFASPTALNVGDATNLIVGFGEPLLTSPATHLGTLNLLYLDESGGAVYLGLHGSEPSTLDPAFPTVLLADGQLMSMGLFHYGYSVGIINPPPSPVPATSLGMVKALYR